MKYQGQLHDRAGHFMIKNRIDNGGREITEYTKSVIAMDMIDGVRYSFLIRGFRTKATIISKFRKIPPILSNPIMIPPIIDSVSEMIKHPSLS